MQELDFENQTRQTNNSDRIRRITAQLLASVHLRLEMEKQEK